MAVLVTLVHGEEFEEFTVDNWREALGDAILIENARHHWGEEALQDHFEFEGGGMESGFYQVGTNDHYVSCQKI